MKFIQKTDKIILFPFIRLFVLVFSLIVFILLMQFFLIFFYELIGKDLGLWIYLQLFFYFGINSTPIAFSLATLIASLMVFGNLGEQLELTALKSAGITFIRILRPLLCLIGFLSVFVYFSNGYLVPQVTVKAWTLLYDLRTKKPSVAIKEGFFYNGLPGYSIRVARKLPDQKTLQDIIIYDHTNNKGNVNMILATSGQLTNSADGQYLVIELFDGNHYIEKQPRQQGKGNASTLPQLTVPDFCRISFKTLKILIDLDAFKLTRTSEQSFSAHQGTKTTSDLIKSIVAMQDKIKNTQKTVIDSMEKYYQLPTPAHTAIASNVTDILSKSTVDGTVRHDASGKILNSTALPQDYSTDSTTSQAISNTANRIALIPFDHPMPDNQRSIPLDSPTSQLLIQELIHRRDRKEIIQKTLRQARDFKYQIESDIHQLISMRRNLAKYQLEQGKRTAYAIACFIMLLIGASLGALIKKGGLGVPFLISTVFVLMYYVVDIFGYKFAKMGLISPMLGAWGGNLVLMPFACCFLWHAQKDTHLLDRDGYRCRWWKKKTSKQKPLALLEGNKSLLKSNQ